MRATLRYARQQEPPLQPVDGDARGASAERAFSDHEHEMIQHINSQGRWSENDAFTRNLPQDRYGFLRLYMETAHAAIQRSQDASKAHNDVHAPLNDYLRKKLHDLDSTPAHDSPPLSLLQLAELLDRAYVGRERYLRQESQRLADQLVVKAETITTQREMLESVSNKRDSVQKQLDDATGEIERLGKVSKETRELAQIRTDQARQWRLQLNEAERWITNYRNEVEAQDNSTMVSVAEISARMDAILRAIENAKPVDGDADGADPNPPLFRDLQKCIEDNMYDAVPYTAPSSYNQHPNAPHRSVVSVEKLREVLKTHDGR